MPAKIRKAMVYGTINGVFLNIFFKVSPPGKIPNQFGLIKNAGASPGIRFTLGYSYLKSESNSLSSVGKSGLVVSLIVTSNQLIKEFS